MTKEKIEKLATILKRNHFYYELGKSSLYSGVMELIKFMQEDIKPLTNEEVEKIVYDIYANSKYK